MYGRIGTWPEKSIQWSSSIWPQGSEPWHVVVVVHRDAELLQVVDALAPPRRLARRLDRRQEQGDQHRDDRDHDQQLDQGEASPSGAASHGFSSMRKCEGRCRANPPGPGRHVAGGIIPIDAQGRGMGNGGDRRPQDRRHPGLIEV